MLVSTRFSKKSGGKMNTMLSEQKRVTFNDMQKFADGGSISKQGLPSIGPGRIPEKFITTKTTSRVADEVPVPGKRKVNAYNYRRGRPMTKIEKALRKLKKFPDGGVLPQQGATFSPNALKEQLPGVTGAQLAELLQGTAQGGQGVVSDTIQYNVPQFDPTQVPTQRNQPIEFTTPSSQFSLEGTPMSVPADKRIAPILGQRKNGGKLCRGGGISKFSKK